MRLIPTTDGRRIDDRAVSEVLGAILIFALVLMLVVIIQVAAVPAMNQQVEFSHNHRVQGDVQDFQSNVDAIAADGGTRSTSIEMGTYYPTRFFLLNPSPPSGTLRTTETTARLDNVVAEGETGDYWNGDPHEYDSVRLTYEPQYNEYESAPRTVYEGWTLFNAHPNTDQTLDDTGPVNGRKIDLVMLDGSLSTTQVAPYVLTATAESAPAETVSVTSDGEPINITLQTELSADEWERILAPETCTDTAPRDFVCDTDSGKHVVAHEVDEAAGEVTITLEKGETYSMRLAKVSLGQEPSPVEPAYATAVGPTDRVLTGTRTEVTVEVRDAFNNPVPGENVSFYSTGASFTDDVVPTDENGRATTGVFPALNVTHVQAYYGSYTPGTDADCDASPQCVLYNITSGGPGTTQLQGEALLVYESSSTDPGAGVVTYNLRNVGGDTLNVVGVRLVHITSLKKTGGGAGGPSTATLVDGPDELVSMTLDGYSRSVGSVEGEGPVFLSEAVPVNSGPAAMRMTFDKSYTFGSGEAIIVSVRLFFAEKSPATYEVYVFAP
ncbi:MAG: Ig-like domain-containing protein [Haloarculaceae archaeon]